MTTTAATRIVVLVRGGVVYDMFASGPGKIELVVVDHDADGDGKEIQIDGDTYPLPQSYWKVSKRKRDVDRVFKRVVRPIKAAEEKYE